jgi:hypothetical protein
MRRFYFSLSIDEERVYCLGRQQAAKLEGFGLQQQFLQSIAAGVGVFAFCPEGLQHLACWRIIIP